MMMADPLVTASVLRKLPINICAAEMSLRWLKTLPVRNSCTIPCVILLCWLFTTTSIPAHAEASLGYGPAFVLEQWRVFGDMNYAVSNLHKCVLHKPDSPSTIKYQKHVIFKLLCQNPSTASLTKRTFLAAASGEIVARARRAQKIGT